MADDKTVIIPQPGRRNIQDDGTLVMPQNDSNTHIQQSVVNSAWPSANSQTNPLNDNSTVYMVPPTTIAESARNLITVLNSLRNLVRHDNITTLREKLVHEVNSFERDAVSVGANREQVICARYALCTAIDEVVMNTPWGTSSDWSYNSLLSIFHNETFGGRHFYEVLDKLLQSPRDNIQVIELYYILLSLGYSGKYRMEADGNAQINALRERLFQTLSQFTGHYNHQLSTCQHEANTVGKRVTEAVPIWVFFCVALAIAIVTYGGFRYWLYSDTTEMTQTIDSLNRQYVSEDN